MGVLVLALVISVLAALNQGVASARVDVNDGGVWVTKTDSRQVAHLNFQAKMLDAGLGIDPKTANFEIGQAADTVTFHDRTTNSVFPIETAGVRKGAVTSLPEGAQLVQGSQRLGVLDPSKGNLWVADANQPADAVYDESHAVVTDMVGGAVTTGVDGTVMAVSASAGRLVTVSREGKSEQVASTPLKNLPLNSQFSLTAVGSKPVAIDTTRQLIIFPDGSQHKLADYGISKKVALQEPGPDADHVLLATANALVLIPLDGSPAKTVPADISDSSGKPANPVRLNGCGYAAWAVSGAYLRLCDGDAEPNRAVDSQLQEASSVRFRTNRDLIVLNDTITGKLWLTDDDIIYVETDWNQLPDDAREEDQQDSPELTQRVADPERKQANSPPIAEDDEFGVRPGQVTTLDVLNNDSDPDGDILTAALVEKDGAKNVTPSRGGQALQIATEQNATGTQTFRYQATDGTDIDQAQVKVSIHPWTQNEGPQQLRTDPRLRLGSMATIKYNLLPDWRDPDGDPIFLEKVTKVPTGLDVQFQQEGTLVIRDFSAKAGAADISVVVSDGKKSTQGKLRVHVQPPGNLAPVANADFYVARVNERIVLQPLANDFDPNGDKLYFRGISKDPPGAITQTQLDAGTVSFTARTVGTYYLVYKVDDGPAASFGVIRVDVVDIDEDAKPVAEDDLALLPANGSVLVAPLNNDSDPTGGVLVIQSIAVDDALGLEVSLVDHHLLRVTSPLGIDEPASFSYTISNGSQTASAKVTVVPTASDDAKRPPELQEDRAKVRVGDIGAVNVLANDYSPAGLTMQVQPVLKYEHKPAVGVPFVTGNQVRLEAGSEPGFLRVGYTVKDSAGHLASSIVTFEVIGMEGANDAPRPEPLTAWAVSGQTTRIPVPLTGIDPNGDSVTLVGIEQPPALGNVKVGISWLEYTPELGKTGTDVLRYIVEDRLGEQASATVRIGVSDPDPLNQRPTAVPDTVLTRPGRLVTVPVLANDFDPNGDEISLVADSLQTQKNSTALAPRIVGSSISVMTPNAEGSYLVTYQITDGRGGFAPGALTVNVRFNASLQPPIARDDVVDVKDMPADDSPIPVQVLLNDEDPDGDPNQLLVSCDAAAVTEQNGTLYITPDESRRMVVYTITDEDGLTGKAVVSVPGTRQEKPRINPALIPVEMRAGEERTFDLTDYVITAAGRTPRITNPELVKATAGADGDPQVNGDLIVFKAAKDFVGDTALLFEVADGPDEDTSRRTASLIIPIRVNPSVNHPPTVRSNPIILAPGEAPVRVNIADWVQDPDGDDALSFGYELTSKPEDVRVDKVGDSLFEFSVPADHPVGAAGVAAINIDDHLDATVPCQIQITVISSTRPLISVQQPILLEGFSGQPIRVNLEDYVSNPFPATPVRVLRTMLIQGAVALAASSPVLVLTPDVAFHGPAEVQFILMDATNDNSRQVRGTLRLTVKGPPDPPTQIEAIPTSGKSAMVSFQAGEDNGAPIEHYNVEADDGNAVRCEGGDTANCEIAGLTSGHEYTFKVSASNEAGVSEWSGWSEKQMIDVAPEPLATPRVEPKDRAIKVTWIKPHTDGSAISQFRIHLTGRDNPIMVGPDVTEREISGLTNGQEYSVSIEAIYASGSIKSDSAAAVPFGKPNKPDRVTIKHEQPDEDAPDMACIRVGWDYLSSDSVNSNNGRPVDKVVVSITRNGTTIFSRTFASGEWMNDSVKVEIPPGSQTTALVYFSTEAGASESSQSEPFQAHGFPTLPSLGTIAPTGNDHEVRLTGLTAVAGNGWDSDQISVQYRIGAGSWYTAPAGCFSGCVIVNDVFQNGRAATLTFRQLGKAGDFEVPGPSFSVGVTPYGPPITPTLTFRWLGDHRVRVSWVAVADNGGPGLSGLLLKVEGHAAESVFPELTGSRDFQFSGDSVDVQLTAIEDGGRARTATGQGSVTWGSVRVVSEPRECPANVLPPLQLPDAQASCSLAKISIERAWSPKTDLTCEFTAADAGNAQITIPEESVAVTTHWRVLDENNPGEHIQCVPKH
jgi:hypothetical protein